MNLDELDIEVLPDKGFLLGWFRHLASTSRCHESPGAIILVYAVPAKTVIDDVPTLLPTFLLRPAGGTAFNRERLKAAFEEWCRTKVAPKLAALTSEPTRVSWRHLPSLGDGKGPWRNTVAARRDATKRLASGDEPAQKGLLRREWLQCPWIFLFDEHNVFRHQSRSLPVEDLPASDAAWVVAQQVAEEVAAEPKDRVAAWPIGGGRPPSYFITDDVLLHHALTAIYGPNKEGVADFVIAAGVASWATDPPEPTRMHGSPLYWREIAKVMDPNLPRTVDPYRRQLQRRVGASKTPIARSCFEPALIPDLDEDNYRDEVYFGAQADIDRWLVTWLRQDRVARMLFAIPGREAANIRFLVPRVGFEGFLKVRFLPFVRTELSAPRGHRVFDSITSLYRSLGDLEAIEGVFTGFVSPRIVSCLQEHARLEDGTVSLLSVVGEDADEEDAWSTYCEWLDEVAHISPAP